jgi:hypothetical protein
MCPYNRQQSRFGPPADFSMNLGPPGSQASTGIISQLLHSLIHARNTPPEERLASTYDLFTSLHMEGVSATSVVTSTEPLADCTCMPLCVRLRRSPTSDCVECHIHQKHCRADWSGVPGLTRSGVLRLRRTIEKEVLPDMFLST